MRARYLVIALVSAILLAIFVSMNGSAPDTLAQAPTSLSIDVIPTDNTATSVVKIDTCASAQNGDVFDIDIVIENVTDLLAWELYLSYDPAVLEVQDHDAAMFQDANQESEVIDLSEGTPDDDGRYLIQSFDSADPSSPDSGSGVLARITLKAQGEGISPVSITEVDLNDDGTPDQGPLLRDVAGEIIGDEDGDTFFDGQTNGAEIRIGELCADPDAKAAVQNRDDSSGVSAGVVVGAVLGGLAAVALMIGLVVVLRRRRATSS